MNYNKYLNKLVEKPNEYVLSIEDKKTIKYEGIEKYIYRKITSTKYRSSRIPDDLNTKIIKTIHYCVINNLPIHFSVPFGGYKQCRLPSFPEVDWSEVFNITFLRDFSLSICAAYKPGVIVEYYSDEIFVSKMNNIPQEQLDLYNMQFELLTSLLGKYCPGNLEIKLSKIRDHISQQEIHRRFDIAISKLKLEWDGLPEDIRTERLAKSERNYNADLNKIPVDRKNELLLASTLIHDAFIFDPNWDKDIPWAFDVDMIPIGFRYTKSWGLNLKSSKTSATQFWVGTGVLHKRNQELLPGILTYKQYESNIDTLSYIDVDSVFGTEFKNLTQIGILPY